MPVCKRHSIAAAVHYTDLLETEMLHDSTDQGMVFTHTYLCHTDILGLATLMPHVTNSLTSTQLTNGLNVYPHQLNLQHYDWLT